jgi:hypothetical protein
MRGLAADVVTAVDDAYGDGHLEAKKLLLQLPGRGVSTERLARCVLFLADGSVAQLRYFVEAATLDEQDVIFWAECDAEGNRLRDFTEAQ